MDCDCPHAAAAEKIGVGERAVPQRANAVVAALPATGRAMVIEIDEDGATVA